MKEYDFKSKFSKILESIDEMKTTSSESVAVQWEGLSKNAVAKLVVVDVLNDLEKLVKNGSLEEFTEYRLRIKLAKELKLVLK